MTFKELQTESGATRSQLIHWADVGWLPSCRGQKKPGTGNHRDYTAADLSAARRAVAAVKTWGPSAARKVFTVSSTVERPAVNRKDAGSNPVP